MRIPTSSSSSCFRLGDVTCSALAGIVLGFWQSDVIRIATARLNFNIRPGGVPRAALASLLLDVGPSGRRSAALNGVVPALLRSGLLGRQGPPNHRLSEHCGRRH